MTTLAGAAARGRLAGADLGLVLGLFVAFGLPMSVVAPLGMAPLAAAAALVVLPVALARRAGPPDATVALLLAALCLWALSSALWAIDRGSALNGAAQLAGVVAGGLVLNAAARTMAAAELARLGAMTVLGVVAAAALVLLDVHSGHILTRLARGRLELPPVPFEPRDVNGPTRAASVLALAGVPAAVAAATRRRLGLAALLLVLVGAAVGAAESLSTKLGLLAGVAAGAAAWRYPHGTARLLAVVVVGAFVAVPLLTNAIPDPRISWQSFPLKASIHHRLTIWGFVTERIDERPLLGWGMNGARHVPGGNEVIVVTRTNPATQAVETVREDLLPLHPHNAVLQVWLELGAVGALLAASLLVAVLRASPDPAQLAFLAAAVTISAIAYGVWQSWFLSSLALLGAVAGAAPGPWRR